MHMAMLGAVLFLVLNLIGWTQGFPVRYCLWLLAVSVIYIFWLRLVDGNLRVLSSFEEYFNLAFLAVVATAGLRASVPHASSSSRSYILGLLTFQPGGTSLAWDQLLAVFLVSLFLIYLPWSKMIHYISKYFTYHHINWQKE
jgi:nitrate reductase gamma subunit